MLKKIIVGLMLFATVSFGMSLTKLNGASKADLMEINGIGEVKATALVKERRKGKFKSFTDLQDRVEGIGEQTAANIKGDVKNANDVKKVVKKKTKSTTKKKVTKKRKTTKADDKKEEIKAKTKRKTKAKSKKKPAKVKKADDKKKVLKKKSRKTKTKKTKTKKTKTKTKKKKAKN